jgi:hypothetical protein
MEESIAGFRVRGTWEDVVEHGERITRALQEADVHEDDQFAAAFEEWDEWRPKAHERIEDEISEKTADQASVGEGDGEMAGKEPDEDLHTAGEKLSESYDKLSDGDDEGAVERWSESIGYVARAADSAGRKALRKVEDTVYQHVMTQLAPYYFDNELISANIQQGADESEFVLEVNVNDEPLKGKVADSLYAYEDTVDRWQIETDPETESIEAAEGVDPPEPEGRPRSTEADVGPGTAATAEADGGGIDDESEDDTK